MNKETRLSIIKRVLDNGVFPALTLNDLIEVFIIDELKYAGSKARREKVSVNEEYKKVIDAYSFDDYKISERVRNYMTHYSTNTLLASMQHFGNYVRYIGEYYDKTPVKIEEAQ